MNIDKRGALSNIPEVIPENIYSLKVLSFTTALRITLLFHLAVKDDVY